MALKKDEILGEWKFEEEFILRVRDSNLANRIRRILREEDEPGQRISIEFEESGVNGTLYFEGAKYQLTVLNLPGVTECYKSYDDVNLVKSGDVGQVLIVGDLIEDEATTGEAKDGITPPMRNARQRVFREPIAVSKETVKKVEEQLFAILDGGAPKGFRYRDYEEIWTIDEKTGKGKWVPADGS